LPPEAVSADAPRTPTSSNEQNQPIDLPTALRLANAQNPDIAVARERIQEALAIQERAEVLWVPNLEAGSTWLRHDGQIQRAGGEIITTSRSSLFVGGGAALNLNAADAIFIPLAARQVTASRRSYAASVANELMLDTSLAYIDLLQARAERIINDETIRHAQLLLSVTEAYEKAGRGAAADTARARTEYLRRERLHLDLQARVGVASAGLVQLLGLPARLTLEPQDSAVVPIAMVSEESTLDDLLAQALRNRPELAENRALAQAALEVWRSAKVAPLIPSLRLSYAAGGFGGGINEHFGDFDGRGDAAATLVWNLENFGLGNRARVRERQSIHAQATLRGVSIENRVMAEIVASFRVAYAKRAELASAQREVAAARTSFQLNAERLRRAPEQGRPIELLQAVQALAQARQDYVRVVADYNRAQFRLYTALGHPPECGLERSVTLPLTEPTVPNRPVVEVPPPPAPTLLPPLSN
jgi:outer membrane protein TolC